MVTWPNKWWQVWSITILMEQGTSCEPQGSTPTSEISCTSDTEIGVGKYYLNVTIMNFLLINFCGTNMTQIFLTCPHKEHHKNGCEFTLPTVTTAKASYF